MSKFFIWTFFVLWTGQSVLSQFGIYDNYIPTGKTIAYVSVHMLFFYAGFRQIKIENSADENYGNVDNLRILVDKISKNPFFITILLFSFFYIVNIFGRFWQAILLAQSISDARADNQLQELYGNFYYYINMLVLFPMSNICIFLFAFKTFEKRDRMWLIMGLFLLMYKSLSGGRLGYFTIFIGIVFVGVYLHTYTKKQTGFIKRYSRFLIMGVLAVGVYFLIGLVTAGRKGDVSMNTQAFNENQETTNMHFYNYYVAPIVAFDYSINNNLVAKQGGYHFGALTFNSVEEFFYVLVHKIGINYKRPIGEYAGLIQDNYIDVGSMGWNALYTWCNIFYFDFGLLGLIIFPFIIGILVRKTIHYFMNNCNVFSASLLVLIYYIVALSVVSFYFNGFTSFFTLAVLLLLSKKQGKHSSKTKELVK